MPTIEESAITQHLLVLSSEGRVLSNVSGETKQYGAACDPSKYALPARLTRTSHSFTDEPRATTCEACKQTPQFAEEYELRTGEVYVYKAPEPKEGNK